MIRAVELLLSRDPFQAKSSVGPEWCQENSGIFSSSGRGGCLLSGSGCDVRWTQPGRMWALPQFLLQSDAIIPAGVGDRSHTFGNACRSPSGFVQIVKKRRPRAYSRIDGLEIQRLSTHSQSISCAHCAELRGFQTYWKAWDAAIAGTSQIESFQGNSNLMMSGSGCCGPFRLLTSDSDISAVPA